MIHFSVDDSIAVFNYITQNNCKSIFENPILQNFKKLNEKYNFAVSMYCFYEKDDFNLSMVSDKYKREFEENAHWLKFGFHGLNTKSNYKDTDAQIFRKELIKTVDTLRNIVSESAMTYDVRLGFGQGNKNCIRVMKECFDAFDVLYGVDDERIVYYLNEDENSSFLQKGMFYDESIGITIKHCEKRLECSTDFPETVNSIDTVGIHPFFTHESRLNDDKILNYIKMLCKTGQAFIA